MTTKNNNATWEPTYVDIKSVPPRVSKTRLIWQQRFAALSRGKAAMAEFETRQRAHQIIQTIRSAAKYYDVAIRTRVIHGEQAINGSEKWLVYYWKDSA